MLDDVEARRLIASILKQAHDDYTKETCPGWCTYIDDCSHRDYDYRMQCDAKKFVKSAWCASLCDGVDIDPDQFRDKLYDKKMTQITARKAEEEIRNYKRLKYELEKLKRDIIYESPTPQEGHSSSIGRPVESAVSKIFADRRIKTLEQTISAIDVVISRCSVNEKQFVEMYYWSRKYTIDGVAIKMDYGVSTVKRWKKKIIRELALELGYI